MVHPHREKDSPTVSIPAVRYGHLVTAALVLSLAACSTPEAATARPSPSASASAPVSPSTGSSPTGSGPHDLNPKLAPYSTTPDIGEPILGTDVAKRFGAARATKTYQDVVAFLRTESFDLDRLRPKSKYAVSDFASVSRHMIPPTRDHWRDSVRKALKGNKDDVGDVEVLAFWDLSDKTYTFAKTGPYVVDEKVGQSVLYIDEETNWLTIAVSYSARVRMVRGGVTYRRPITKQVTLVVIPGAANWLMISYRGSWNFGKALPE